MILHLFSIYEDVLRGMPRKKISEPYLFQQGFGWSGFFSAALSRLGVPAETFVANPAVNDAKTLYQRCLTASPEILLAQGIGHLPLRWLEEMKTELRSKNKDFRLVGWSGAPFTSLDLEKYKACDLVLTCNPRTVTELKQNGIDSDLLHHGFPQEFYMRKAPHLNPSENHALVFAGSLLQGSGFHEGRIQFLKTIKDQNIPLKIFSKSPHYKKLFLKRTLGEIASTQIHNPFLPRHLVSRFLPWKSIRPIDSPLRELARSFQSPRYGFELLDLLSSSQMCLNFHIDHSGAFAGNHRLFEATGAGSCLITDQKQNLSELFVLEDEIISYDSTQECIEKIKYLFSHPAKVREIADRGKKRCLKEHTFDHRAVQFLDLLKQRGWFQKH